MDSAELAPARVSSSLLLVSPHPNDVVASLADRAEWAVDVAPSTDEALEAIESGQFDCLISDHDPPELDGVGLLESVRERRPDLPVVFYPTAGSERLASEACAAGVTDYVRVADTDLETLSSRLHEAISADPGRRPTADSSINHALLTAIPPDEAFVIDEAGRIVEHVSGGASPALSTTPGTSPGSLLVDVFPAEEAARFQATVDQALETGAVETLEYELDGPDGRRWFEARVKALDWSIRGRRAVVWVSRDVTSCKRAEAGRAESDRKFRAVFEEAFDAMMLANDEGRYVDVNRAACEMFGLDEDDLLGRSIGEFAPDDYDFAGAWAAFQQSDQDRGEFPLVRADGEQRVVEFAATPNVVPGVHLSILRDVTERTKHERTLHTLHDSTRRLFDAERVEEVADLVVEAASDVVALPGVGVFLYDETTNALQPTAYSAGGDGVGGTVPSLRVHGENLSARAFLDGETVVVDDVLASDVLNADGMPYRSLLLVPLGDHGVLAAGSTHPGTFDDRVQELTELLAATTEAALDRVTREQVIRSRDRELEYQTARLMRLDRTNEKIRAISQALVRADTRQEVERAVCEQLAFVDDYAFVWIGRHDPVDGRIVPRTWTEDDHGYLDDVADSLRDGGTEPAVRVLETERSVVVDSVAAHLSEGWRKQALARNFRSVFAVPLRYGDVSYGVMVVYADRTAAFDDRNRAILEEMGETVAYAVSSLERKEALMTNRVTELAFEITDPDCLLLGLARRADCSLTFENVVFGAGSETNAFVTVSDGAPSRLVEVAETSVDVSDARLIGADDQVQLTLTDRFITTLLAEHGIVLRAMSATPERARLTIEVPSPTDVQRATDLLTTTFADPSLVSRREFDRPPAGPSNRGSMLDGLTDRQREVVELAYHGGYFEWPRTSTGEQLADSVDLSAPTFHRHLRLAERKLLGAVFESA